MRDGNTEFRMNKAVMEQGGLNLLGPLHVLWLLSLEFCGAPNSGNGGVSDSFSSSWNPFPPTG